MEKGFEGLTHGKLCEELATRKVILRNLPHGNWSLEDCHTETAFGEGLHKENGFRGLPH